jgi:nucleoside-diphosphate-sugar epimerase
MYLVTGASGFIGKHLLDALTKRGQTIYCLVYPPAVADFHDLIDEHPCAACPRTRSTSSGTTYGTCSTSRRSTT